MSEANPLQDALASDVFAPWYSGQTDVQVDEGLRVVALTLL